MRVKTLAEIPEKYSCRVCGGEKPICEIVVVRSGDFILVRPRCKACHNQRERGNRREYKRNYLRRWRRNNPELNESYWRIWQAQNRLHINQVAAKRCRRYRHALAIQRRLRSQVGMHVSLSEARGLLRKFGKCYPTRFGLTEAGLRECERIRSQLRRGGKQAMSGVEIRMMVYEDAYEDQQIVIRGDLDQMCTVGNARLFMVAPKEQIAPYQRAAENLRRFWKQKKAGAA